MPKEEECVSSAAAWSFYTHPGRHPFGQAEAWRLGDVRIEPSAALGATSTLPGQQPFRQVVAWRLGDVRTDPSSSLSPKRRGHAPLIAWPGLDHQLSWTNHLIHPARRECVPPCFDILSWQPMSSISWRPSRQWERPCVSRLFLTLPRRPLPPRATTALERPPAPRLPRPWPEWVHPNDTDPLEVLDHPAAAGVVDDTASDCLPT